MLSEQVYDELLKKLMSGELVPGEIINRRQIASEIGTSVAPVLEAMKQLEFEGYLETIPRKGTQVKIIRRDDVIGKLLVRTGIECMAVRAAACAGAFEENFDRLTARAEEAENAMIKYGASPESWKADVQFHTELVDVCGNSALSAEYRRIAVPNLFYQLNTVLRLGGYERNDHIVLVKQLSCADADNAEKIILRHLKSGSELLNII